MKIFRERELYFQKKCSKEDFQASEKTLVGIHGIKGAFTDEALFRFTHEFLEIDENSYEISELVHAKNVLEAVSSGKTERGIFAFANSGSGGYQASIEAMGMYNFEVLAMFTMPINMCLIVHPDIQDISEVTEFTGHPVAVTMCRNTLKERWPDIPMNPLTDELDTALSVKSLMEGELPKTAAVFAAKRAADIYGAKVLEEGVHDDPNNATSFAVVKKRA